jgi:hypothetical protein
MKKRLHRAKHETATACRQGKVGQVYIKSECGQSILVDTVNWLDTIICWTHCILEICLVLLVQVLNMASKYENI